MIIAFDNVIHLIVIPEVVESPLGNIGDVFVLAGKNSAELRIPVCYESILAVGVVDFKVLKSFDILVSSVIVVVEDAVLYVVHLVVSPVGCKGIVYNFKVFCLFSSLCAIFAEFAAADDIIHIVLRPYITVDEIGAPGCLERVGTLCDNVVTERLLLVGVCAVIGSVNSVLNDVVKTKLCPLSLACLVILDSLILDPLSDESLLTVYSDSVKEYESLSVG